MAAWHITARPSYETNTITQARIRKGYSQQKQKLLFVMSLYQDYQLKAKDLEMVLLPI